MNTLIYYSFSLLFLSVLVLVIGMIKPKWILIWVDNPGRLPITMISMVLFMIFAVMFGEGNKQLKQEKEKQQATQQMTKPTNEVPDLH